MLTKQPILLNDYALKSNRVDLWVYSLNNNNPEAISQLSPDEQLRASRFYFSHHQRRFANAHHMLRLILGRYINEHPLSLDFATGQHGKPELVNAPFLQFNLSHSGETAVLAVSRDYPLGVDIEYFSSRPYDGIAENLFSTKEIQTLKASSAALRPLIFFNIWAQKEALIKACGLGLSYPTQQFDVPILSSQPQMVTDHLHQRSWKMMSFMPQIACCAALCCDERVEEVRYQVLESGLSEFVP